MTGSVIPFIQINLHHSRCSSLVLARSMAEMLTCIAIIQEPWIVKGAIRGLGSCGKVYKADTTDKI
jgi:hypothetical protein